MAGPLDAVTPTQATMTLRKTLFDLKRELPHYIPDDATKIYFNNKIDTALRETQFLLVKMEE